MITTAGEYMKKDQVYTDEHGNRWITPARVADIWNERADNEYKRKGNYTRWSVYQRKDKLKKITTPYGDLYSEEEAYKTELRPHSSKRPDVAEKNSSRKKKIPATSENSQSTP